MFIRYKQNYLVSVIFFAVYIYFFIVKFSEISSLQSNYLEGFFCFTVFVLFTFLLMALQSSLKTMISHK